MDQQPIYGYNPSIFMLDGLKKRREFLWLSWLTIQYNTIQYNAMQYKAMQFNTIQYANRAPLDESGTKVGRCHTVHALKCQ